MKRPALFLDRDGIINQMVSYPGAQPFDSPQTPSDVKLVNGIVDIIKWANDRGLLVIEVTNQPGVAKGKMSQTTANAIEARAHQLLTDRGVKIDKTYTCPHHPSGVYPQLAKKCDCRKPKPGLLLQASKQFNLDLTKSIILGDSLPDVGAGLAVGCKTIIYIHNHNLSNKVTEAHHAPADYQVTSLTQVIPLLEKFFSPSPTSL